MVTVSGVEEKRDRDELFNIISAHAKETASPLAKRILSDFDKYVLNFKKIIPTDYKKMTEAIEKLEAEGKTYDEARLEAFHSVQR